jgi:hypothetical protein
MDFNAVCKYASDKGLTIYKALYEMGLYESVERRRWKAEYSSYTCAKNRCNSQSSKNWHNYGGRGIEFRFRNFRQFIRELGPRPDGKSLDRINNDGHYEPGNVRWATPKEQCNNTRRNKKRDAQ